MAKQNTLQDVKKRMKALQDSKAAQLDTIRQKQDEIRTQIEAAALDMKQATEEMDVDRYEEARSRRRKAQTALDMYTGRYKQIEAQEYISEAESDRVIDSLLAYEEEMAAKFEADIVAPLKALEKLLADYTQEVADTESTLKTWQRDIHANYNTRGAALYFDKETGQHIPRSATPYPVHGTLYEGCSASILLREMLEGRLEEYVKG